MVVVVGGGGGGGDSKHHNTHSLSQDFKFKTVKVSQLASPGLPGYSPSPRSLLPLVSDVSLLISLTQLLLPGRAGDLHFEIC